MWYSPAPRRKPPEALIIGPPPLVAFSVPLPINRDPRSPKPKVIAIAFDCFSVSNDDVLAKTGNIIVYTKNSALIDHAGEFQA